MDLIITSVASLVVGLVGGYALQMLATRRSQQERKALTDLATLDRCVEIFNARVEYIIAYHTANAATRDRRNEEYLSLLYGNLHAMPETHIPDETFQVWMRAEAGARNGSLPIASRMDEVKSARWAVLSWLTERRAELQAAV